ncbi:MAG: hypothetical protein ACOC7R_03560 [Planctomycetota bacterium]
MIYRTDVFGFTDDALTRFAEPHAIERMARIDGDTLIMESAVDRRILRADELPADGPRLETRMPLLDWAFRIARRDIELNFYAGGMSEWDMTYFNGTEIGRTGSDDAPAGDRPRRYRIAAEWVKAGEVNTIAVKVWCSGVNSGIHTGPVVIAPEEQFDRAIAPGRRVTEANVLPEVG